MCSVETFRLKNLKPRDILSLSRDLRAHPVPWNLREGRGLSWNLMKFKNNIDLKLGPFKTVKKIGLSFSRLL